ncbi:MAG: hypothetical protein PHC89_00340 [Candidatus Pacebacteria bacterium]|nr:hypothetical protein [Candidatus Paceibacterota bacterium]
MEVFLNQDSLGADDTLENLQKILKRYLVTKASLKGCGEGVLTALHIGGYWNPFMGYWPLVVAVTLQSQKEYLHQAFAFSSLSVIYDEDRILFDGVASDEKTERRIELAFFSH